MADKDSFLAAFERAEEKEIMHAAVDPDLVKKVKEQAYAAKNRIATKTKDITETAKAKAQALTDKAGAAVNAYSQGAKARTDAKMYAKEQQAQFNNTHWWQAHRARQDRIRREKTIGRGAMMAGLGAYSLAKRREDRKDKEADARIEEARNRRR